MNYPGNFIKGSVAFILLLFLCLSVNGFSLQQSQYGMFYVPQLSEWNYVSAQSSDEYFVFQNDKSSEKVRIGSSPLTCETKQIFNKYILDIIQTYFKQNQFMEQRKQAVPYPCFGQQYCHMLIIKSRESDERKFILNPLVDNKMYTIEISGTNNQTAPSPGALHFISQITLEPRIEVLSQETNPATNQPTNIPEQQAMETGESNNLTTFKKNKTVAAPTTTKTDQTKTEPTNTKTEIPKQTPKTNLPATTNSSVKLPNISAPEVRIEKGNIPQLKFSATNPCSGNSDISGLPWENSQNEKVKMPAGIDVVLPAPIPGLNNLTDHIYNSSVSSAFEAMRLVYGEMTEKEAKEFNEAWAPLFDFPSQEVIDYLNKLNPLVSQFLICREAYARNFAAVQMVLLDAATAIEFNEPEAWKAAMTEASIYNSSLPALESAMNQLIKQVEILGNPPNPVSAKCEARRRYKKMLSDAGNPVGCWAGIRDNLAISSDQLGMVYEPKFVYIFSVKVNGIEKYYSIDVCMDCNIGMSNARGNCSTGDYSDEFVKNNLMTTEQYTGKWIDGPRQGQMSQYITKFEYPNIPEFSETSDAQLQSIIKKDKEINGNWSIWESTINNMIQSKRVAHAFYQTALEWSENKRWEDFDYPDDSWMCPDDVLVAFWNDMSAGSLNESPEEEKEHTQKNPPVVENANNNKPGDDEIAAKNLQEAIDFHNEMVGVIKHNLDRELKERNEVYKKLVGSANEKEYKEHERRLKDLDLRIIGLQSNIQSEMDLVASYKTGQLVHTRTAFDNYAQQKFIHGIKENIQRIEQTRKISERINRQIKLLPEEQQEKARELARDVIDGKTIASGDVEKARKLVDAFGKQIEGYAGYDYAQAKEEEALAELKEQGAQAAIMVVGVVAVGFGSAALVEAYGAEAAAAIYGPKILGAIYGGTTGLIRGGPKEGMSQALMGWSPNGYAVSQFIEGFQNAGSNKNATWSDQAWEGAKQAGYAYCVGKVFELGIRGLTKGLLAWRGPESRLFKPVVQTQAQRSRQLQDVLRSKQLEMEADDIVHAFEKIENELATLKMDEVRNSLKIQQLEDELQQLTASMNASYNAKWHFKYKASPRTMRAFDRRIQQNYANMEPGMVQRMEDMGYKMDRIEFKQFRNAGSGGTSSMDLDLNPVQRGTGKPKTVFMKKDGTVVSAEEFMNDCQAAMNAEYRKLTGISAPSSDMNLITSAHREAFATPKLLDKNIDMSDFTDDEIKSIGEVLRVKAEGIDGNSMLSNTFKMQAKARETSKEIENMLLRKLRSDLNNVPPGSVQARAIQDKITYWENMLKRFKQIGMQESDPSTLMELSSQIRKETGGKDVHAVMDDVINFFGATP